MEFPPLQLASDIQAHSAPEIASADPIADLGSTVPALSPAEFKTFMPTKRGAPKVECLRSSSLRADFEETIASAEAWVMLASIRVLSRRLARA
jgi:hypothetical protein